jgi:hypothetical protein
MPLWVIQEEYTKLHGYINQELLTKECCVNMRLIHSEKSTPETRGVNVKFEITSTVNFKMKCYLITCVTKAV